MNETEKFALMHKAADAGTPPHPEPNVPPKTIKRDPRGSHHMLQKFGPIRQGGGNMQSNYDNWQRKNGR